VNVSVPGTRIVPSVREVTEFWELMKPVWITLPNPSVLIE